MAQRVGELAAGDVEVGLGVRQLGPQRLGLGALPRRKRVEHALRTFGPVEHAQPAAQPPDPQVRDSPVTSARNAPPAAPRVISSSSGRSRGSTAGEAYRSQPGESFQGIPSPRGRGRARAAARRRRRGRDRGRGRGPRARCRSARGLHRSRLRPARQPPRAFAPATRRSCTARARPPSRSSRCSTCLAQRPGDRPALATRLEPAAIAARPRRRIPTRSIDETARCVALGDVPDSRAVRSSSSRQGPATSGSPPRRRSSRAAFGAGVRRICDVGVAGLHRLLAERDALAGADCLVVVAGMEGALPSVVGGLVGTPIVAVPTSVGYGASFGGIAALLAMLNSCAPGVTVVNIDNGFGAGVFAAPGRPQRRRLAARHEPSRLARLRLRRQRRHAARRARATSARSRSTASWSTRSTELGVSHRHAMTTTRGGAGARRRRRRRLRPTSPHRTLDDVRADHRRRRRARSVVQGSRARGVQRLAAAEAAVHGDDGRPRSSSTRSARSTRSSTCSAAASGLHTLGLDELVVSPIALGGGTADAAHGPVPVPTPAALGAARRVHLADVPAAGDVELATPTGLAVLAEWATRSGPMPAMQVIGDRRRRRGSRPRRAPERRTARGRRVPRTLLPPRTSWVVVEANVDDLDPRLWPGVLAGCSRPAPPTPG